MSNTDDRRFTEQPRSVGSWADMDLDGLLQDAQQMQPGPIRSALEQRLATEQQRRLWANPLYSALKGAGITITPHADDPSVGWFFTCPAGQYGPFTTPEQAATEGLQALISTALAAQAQPTDPGVAAALHMAIWSLRSDKDSQRHLVKDWKTYGEALAFRREECRRAAQHSKEIDQAIAVLEGLKP
jgi:hypothetical protein